jgi:hypothetical protein
MESNSEKVNLLRDYCKPAYLVLFVALFIVSQPVYLVLVVVHLFYSLYANKLTQSINNYILLAEITENFLLHSQSIVLISKNNYHHGTW